MSQVDVPLSRSGFWTDTASRQLVGATAGCVSWFVGIHRLLHVGRTAGAAFQLRAVSFAVLFARIVRPCPEGWFGRMPSWIPVWVTGAMLILWAPGGFRVTCYYYRGAYYKAFWADPPSCTVGEPGRHISANDRFL